MVARRLDRVAQQQQRAEAQLVAQFVAQLAEALRVAQWTSDASASAALYRRCQAVIASAGLGEGATGRALEAALIAVGFEQSGVRECVRDTPHTLVLAVACLGPQILTLRDLGETERLARIHTYLDLAGIDEGWWGDGADGVIHDVVVP